MAARIFRIIIQVGDTATAARDYATLLGTEARAVGGGRVYLDCGPVILALLAPEAPAPLPDHLYLAVPADELEAVHARAKRLGWLSSTPVHGAAGGEIGRRPWGERSFYADDPWGNALCFVDDSTLFTGADRRG